MAGITKVEKERREQEAKIKSENEELKKQIEEMKALLQQQLDNAKKVNTDDTEKEEKSKDVSMNETVTEVKEDSEDLPMTKRITITSLSTSGINLKTATSGNAWNFRLERLGQTIPIQYEHLIACINNDRWLFEDGLVYINNEQAVREQYLEEYYQKFLDLKTIQNIMDFDIATITEMLNNTTEAIKETIALLVARKYNEHGFMDLNKIEAIGKLCNVNIQELADRIK